MSLSRILNLPIFISVLSIGLFTGFVTFFTFSAAPAIGQTNEHIFFEVHQVFNPSFRFRVLLVYMVMILSTCFWFFSLIKKWRSLEFVCVTGALFCILEEILLSYKGHYKINQTLQTFHHSSEIMPYWQMLHSEWAQFMYLHLAVNGAGFFMILMAHHLHISKKMQSFLEEK